MIKDERRRFQRIRQHGMKSTAIGVTVLLLGATVIFSTFLGPVKIPVGEVLVIYLKQVPFLAHIIKAPVSTKDYEIVVLLREPEVIGGVIVGASLGIGGAVVQSIFRNPITEPYVIGLSSGASIGAVSSIIFGLSFFGLFTVPLMAFLFAIIVVTMVYMLSIRKSGVSPTYLLLTGIAVSFFVSSIVALLLFTNIQLEGSAFFWLLGSLSGITWVELIPVAVIVVSSSVIISLFHRELDALQMGEFHARSVGVPVENVKRIMIVLMTLSVSAAVSISGIIGFVGLIIPHISRLLYGGSNKYVIPSSGILGGLFLLGADDVARTIVPGTVIPIGIVTGMVGVPIFMYLLRRLAGGAYDR